MSALRQAQGDKGKAIPAKDVIDLNGFELKATNASNTAFGIYASGRNGVVVKNGAITYFSSGITLESSGGPVDEIGYVIDGIRANMTNNFGAGLEAQGIGSIIRNCLVVGPATIVPSSMGIVSVGDGATAINNDVLNADTGIYATNGDGIVIENNRVSSVTLALRGMIITSSGNSHVVNNRINNAATGIQFNGAGKYRDNVTINCTTPFSGGTDIGNNN